MEWLINPVPHIWQWVGLLASILGTAAALWAALSAMAANKQAKAARTAAIRLGSVVHLSDLLEDMQELQATLARANFEGVAAKAGTIRGRIQRFGQQQVAYGLSTEATDKSLETAKGQLGIILDVATTYRGKPENRRGKIQSAVADAYQAFAIQHAAVDEEESKP